MANEQNLIPGGYKLSREEASKGGKKSGEVRRQKRDIKRALDMLLEKDYKGKKGESKTGAELIAFRLFEKALNGDIRAFEVVRDSAGQKPVEKIQVEEVDAGVLEELEKMVLDD